MDAPDGHTRWTHPMDTPDGHTRWTPPMDTPDEQAFSMDTPDGQAFSNTLILGLLGMDSSKFSMEQLTLVEYQVIIGNKSEVQPILHV